MSGPPTLDKAVTYAQTVRGYDEVKTAVHRDLTPEDLVHDLGIRGLTWLIEAVLDERYPADIFGDGSILYPSWASEHGGGNFDPGIRWCALLRTAVKEVP